MKTQNMNFLLPRDQQIVNLNKLFKTNNFLDNISGLEYCDSFQTLQPLIDEEQKNKRKEYECLTTENPININYIQTYSQSPVWQLEDYFVL